VARNWGLDQVMIDTALCGLLWAQEHIPTAAYVDAIWAARYPDFANGNAPKARGTWPYYRAKPAIALSPVTRPAPKATNITAIKSARKKTDQDRIAGAVAQIAEQLHEQTNASARGPG